MKDLKVLKLTAFDGKIVSEDLVAEHSSGVLRILLKKVNPSSDPQAPNFNSLSPATKNSESYLNLKF